MSIVYLSLGANLDQPIVQIQRAIGLLNTLTQTTLIQTSSLYRSAPYGYIDQPDFINAVAAINTLLTPDNLLNALLEMEHQFGRTRTFKNAPRTLDLDILLYDQLIIDTPHLTLPHPRMHERAFVILPLLEIAPELVINGIGDIKNLSTYLLSLPNSHLQLTKLSPS